ncbi:MAG: ester cyclase [Treponema sp.]|jgi:predicted ester cyclase|nr:ester cyclase [Treponema sp.]
MNIEEMKRIMVLFFHAMNDKNSSLIEDYLADTIKWHNGCYGENGSDVIINWQKQDFINFAILGNGYFDFEKKTTLNFHIAEGEKIFTHFTYEGIHNKGNIWSYPPTGKKIRFNALYTTLFENGLITEIWVTFEGAAILHQLGIVNLGNGG